MIDKNNYCYFQTAFFCIKQFIFSPYKMTNTISCYLTLFFSAIRLHGKCLTDRNHRFISDRIQNIHGHCVGLFFLCTKIMLAFSNDWNIFDWDCSPSNEKIEISLPVSIYTQILIYIYQLTQLKDNRKVDVWTAWN